MTETTRDAIVEAAAKLSAQSHRMMRAAQSLTRTALRLATIDQPTRFYRRLRSISRRACQSRSWRRKSRRRLMRSCRLSGRQRLRKGGSEQPRSDWRTSAGSKAATLIATTRRKW